MQSTDIPSSSTSTTPSTTASSNTAPSTSSRHVLLFLDVQTGPLADPPSGVPSAPTLRTNLHLVLSHARSASPPPLIIHIRNAGDSGDPDEPHTPGWALFFPPLPHEPIIDKHKNNAFAGTRLAELVSPDAEIVVVGMQSDFCVRATCSAALGRGNNVLLIRGAHATYDGVELLGVGRVTPASRIEADIEAELEEAGVVVLEMKDLSGIFTDR